MHGVHKIVLPVFYISKHAMFFI